jgi:1,4-dihydroxy-2-naphthoate octaprenyltransferase
MATLPLWMAAGFLYGVISANKFVEVFNHYEDSHTAQGEVITTLKSLSKSDIILYRVNPRKMMTPVLLFVSY